MQFPKTIAHESFLAKEPMVLFSYFSFFHRCCEILAKNTSTLRFVARPSTSVGCVHRISQQASISDIAGLRVTEPISTVYDFVPLTQFIASGTRCATPLMTMIIGTMGAVERRIVAQIGPLEACNVTLTLEYK